MTRLLQYLDEVCYESMVKAKREVVTVNEGNDMYCCDGWNEAEEGAHVTELSSCCN